MYICTYAFMHTYNIHMYLCMAVRIDSQFNNIHICMYVCIYICIYTHKYNTCVYMYVCKYMYIHMHANTIEHLTNGVGA